VPDLFSQEAQASDQAGIHKYSEDLVGLVVPEQAGKDYIHSLAELLATAEAMAREGKGSLVPEDQVARTFDYLMGRIGAPQNLKADLVSIRELRIHGAAMPSYSALFSANRNGANCNPGEALFLLYLLLAYNGKLSRRILDNSQELRRTEGTASGFSFPSLSNSLSISEANRLLTYYSSHHNRRATIKLFNAATQSLGY